MKKYFILAAAALVALSACTKLEPVEVPAQKISFQAANYVGQTKADEVSVLSDFTSFKCMAFLHAEGINLNDNGTVKTTTSYQDFFGTAGETISPDNTTSPTLWAPSHDYYWPKGDKSFVNFVAWYGTDGENPVNPTVTYAYDNTAAKYKATMVWTLSSSAVGQAGSNFMYADMAWRYKQNTDPAKYGVSGSSEGVPMLFHHALAQINVKAYASGTTTDPLVAGTNSVSDSKATWTISLEDVKITPVHKSGTLTLTNLDPEGTSFNLNPLTWNTDGWQGSDTAGDLETSYTQANPFKIEKVSQATAADLIAATCVLPQSIGSSVVLNFNMRITTTYKETPTNPNTELIPVSINIGEGGFGTANWEMNHKYTYYVKIVPSQNKVLFDPALDAAWIAVPATGTNEIGF